MKNLFIALMLVSGAAWADGINNPSTFSGGTITTPIEAASGSPGAPSYAFSASTQTGSYYTVNGGTHTYAMTVDGRIVGYWQIQPGSDPGHNNPEGYRPILWIGPGIISSTFTQLGEGLNVWGDTDGNGTEPQIDIVDTNLGLGDARVLAQANLAATPNTVIAYMAGYGDGHGGNYWPSGPLYKRSVAFISQAPYTNMFQMITSSQTYFWNENTTHAAYHFVHGAENTTHSDDLTFVDNQIGFASGGGLTGTTAADSAGAGVVGEYISSTTLNASCTPSSRADMASIVLTAGDWDITATADSYSSNATFSSPYWDLAISTTSGNNSTGLTEGVNWVFQYAAANVATTNVVPWRVNNSSQFTYYMKVRCLSTGGNTPLINGTIWARRRR